MVEQGWRVQNPAELDERAGFPLKRLKQLTPTEFQEFLKGAMKRDLEAIQSCDALVLLPGWESSKGARAEKAVAEWGGKRVGYLNKDSGNGEGAGEWWVEWEGEKQDSKPQPDADGWIPHVPGDPMPCDGYLEVDYKMRIRESQFPSKAEVLDWGSGKTSEITEIIAWRPHQPKQPLPYNSDERAEWNSDSCKINFGDYSSTATAQYAADDPKGAAGAKKAPMHLLPPDALIEIAKVMGEGARKYKPWNFIAARVCASTYIGAILRHWAEFAKGRDMDDGVGGSGLSHLSHIAANCMILLTAKQQGTLNDDRPKLK
jgi:hypothetical protein